MPSNIVMPGFSKSAPLNVVGYDECFSSTSKPSHLSIHKAQRLLSSALFQESLDSANTKLTKTIAELEQTQATLVANAKSVDTFTEDPQPHQDRPMLAASEQEAAWESAYMALSQSNNFMQEIKSKTFEHTTCRKHIIKMNKEISSKDRAIVAREEELRDMHAELQEVKQDVTRKEIELQKVSQELASTQVEAHSANHMRKVLSQELVNVEKVLYRERMELDRLDKKYDLQEDWIKHVESQVERRNKRIEQLEKEVEWAKNTINNEFEKFKTNLAARESEIDTVKALNARLADQINFLERAEPHQATVEIHPVPKCSVGESPSNDATVHTTQDMLLSILCRDIEARSGYQEQQHVMKNTLMSVFMWMFRRPRVIISQPWR
jgi:DNA repair exonuclease SbcCD ATPase subunit